MCIHYCAPPIYVATETSLYVIRDYKTGPCRNPTSMEDYCFMASLNQRIQRVASFKFRCPTSIKFEFLAHNDLWLAKISLLAVYTVYKSNALIARQTSQIHVDIAQVWLSRHNYISCCCSSKCFLCIYTGNLPLMEINVDVEVTISCIWPIFTDLTTKSPSKTAKHSPFWCLTMVSPGFSELPDWCMWGAKNLYGKIAVHLFQVKDAKYVQGALIP